MARTFSPSEYIGSLEASIRAPESSAPAIGCALVEAGTNQLGWTASAVALDSAVVHKTGTETITGTKSFYGSSNEEFDGIVVGPLNQSQQVKIGYAGIQSSFQLKFKSNLGSGELFRFLNNYDTPLLTLNHNGVVATSGPINGLTISKINSERVALGSESNPTALTLIQDNATLAGTLTALAFKGPTGNGVHSQMSLGPLAKVGGSDQGLVLGTDWTVEQLRLRGGPGRISFNYGNGNGTRSLGMLNAELAVLANNATDSGTDTLGKMQASNFTAFSDASNYWSVGGEAMTGVDLGTQTISISRAYGGQIAVTSAGRLSFSDGGSLQNAFDAAYGRRGVGQLGTFSNNGLAVRNYANNADAPISASQLTLGPNHSINYAVANGQLNAYVGASLTWSSGQVRIPNGSRLEFPSQVNAAYIGSIKGASGLTSGIAIYDANTTTFGTLEAGAATFSGDTIVGGSTSTSNRSLSILNTSGRGLVATATGTASPGTILTSTGPGVCVISFGSGVSIGSTPRNTSNLGNDGANYFAAVWARRFSSSGPSGEGETVFASGSVSDAIHFQQGTTPIARFAGTTGNLLLGTSTDNGSKLNVNGAITASSYTAPNNQANSTSGTMYRNFGYLILNGGENGTIINDSTGSGAGVLIAGIAVLNGMRLNASAVSYTAGQFHYSGNAVNINGGSSGVKILKNDGNPGGSLEAGAITLSGLTPALRINQSGGDPNYNMFEVTANGKNLFKVDAIGYGGDTAYVKFGSTYGLLFQPSHNLGGINNFTSAAQLGFNAGGQRMTFGFYYNEYPGAHVFNGAGIGDGTIYAGSVELSSIRVNNQAILSGTSSRLTVKEVGSTNLTAIEGRNAGDVGIWSIGGHAPLIIGSLGQLVSLRNMNNSAWSELQCGATQVSGSITASGDIRQGYVSTSPSARSVMTAAGARKSEVGDGAGVWQSTIREEYNTSGARLAIYGKTPIAQQTAPSVATDLASAITAVNTHTTSLTSFGLYA